MAKGTKYSQQFKEDALIQTLLETAESLCKDIVRTNSDEMEVLMDCSNDFLE